MTQEEKKLLLKDLCARLPYGVKLNIKGQDGTKLYNFNEDLYIIWIEGGFSINDRGEGDENGICEIKPYLRPMSSMTKEECNELGNIKATIENISEVIPNVPYYIEVAYSKQIDWLNTHHFDYRGLIEKGLALEAPKGMYNIKEK